MHSACCSSALTPPRPHPLFRRPTRTLTVAPGSNRAQLFMSLEKVESDLAEVTLKKEQLEEEVLTARQLSARGGTAEPKFIEIHHHNDLEDDSDNDDAKPPAPPPPAP